jgi:hypothetical protein
MKNSFRLGSSSLEMLIALAIMLAATMPAFGQDDSPQAPPPRPIAISGPVTVSVDASKPGNFLAPRALGVQASIYDSDMTNSTVVDLLRSAGILTLRYPGARATDQNHWSTFNKYDGRHPVDFGNFVRTVDKLGGTMVLGVDYGSNLTDKGPGEPAEAAAWVAYANGKPDNTTIIGLDSTGNDWKTVGYWATMRSSAPLARDDGYNFLRLSHPQQLNVKYWEIGNELYANGYYANSNAETDHHAAYDADAKKSAALRLKTATLSPTAYGQGVSAFAKAMKAVDPRISIGVTLNLLPNDANWGPDWNGSVLKACAPNVDFAVLHWYPGNFAPPDWRNLDDANFLAAPSDDLPKIIAALIEEMKAAGKDLQLAVTEINSRPYARVTNPEVLGLFAADAYASLAEDGAVNIDWSELHGDTFVNKSNQPQPAYFGIEMVHKLLNMRESFLAVKSSNPLLTVHAAKHADGSVGIMLLNKDPKTTATVKVKISGVALAKVGTRYDFGAMDGSANAGIRQSAEESLGNSFTVTVKPYTVTDLSIPLAK